MKIAIATHTTARIGGIETYLADIIPALRAAGHEIVVICERRAGPADESILGRSTIGQIAGGPIARGPIAGEVITRGDDVRVIGCVDDLIRWRPDIIYMHGMHDAKLEARIADVAPAVFFVHNYHGTCISGAKRFALPVLRPCDRTFGIACLACYYPRRCGGLNPVTMSRLFAAQRRRLRTVRRCAAVVTHSFHMYGEYARHGVAIDRLHRFAYYSPHRSMDVEPLAASQTGKPNPWQRPPRQPLRLAFAGRLDVSKGVHLLIDAAPIVANRLNRAIVVSIAGDGPIRAQLERAARQTESAHPSLRFEFTGWLARDAVASHLAAADVVAFPSAWPEPFGLVGPEAGHLGIPVAAFAVGGVRGWLVDGVNGFLAPGNPPTAMGLAAAIASCLRDEATYQRLRLGAIEMAARFSRPNHLEELLSLFERVAGDAARCQTASGRETLPASAVAVNPE